MNLKTLTLNFQQALIDNKDIDIKLYCAGYQEFSKLLSKLGAIFSFVVQDVNSKIDILENLVSKDPQNFKTLISMIDIEMTLKSQKDIGCRTFLRLHRALKFLYVLLERILEDDNETLKAIVNESYDNTLAQFHPRLVRYSVKMAVHFLPIKEKFLESIMDDQPCDHDLNSIQGCRAYTATETIPVLKNIYLCCDDLYMKNKLHDLP